MESVLDKPKNKGGRPKERPLSDFIHPQEAVQYQSHQEIARAVTAGNIADATKEYLDGDIESVTKEAALRFASLEHSIIKGPRILAWFFKIEELGMQGNLKAFEILLDRAFGKVTETIAVAHGEFEGMKDGELLKALEGVKALRKKDN